jgi:divalent metal cation (Fe/Co/Zn/Cd) transporter
MVKKLKISLVEIIFLFIYSIIISFTLGKAYKLYQIAIATPSQQILTFSTPLDYLTDIITMMLVIIGLILDHFRISKLEEELEKLTRQNKNSKIKKRKMKISIY